MPSPSDQQPVVQVKRASKILPFGVADLRRAFIDLNLDIHHGSRIALFSINGYEAKSLLECIAGVAQPDQGSILHNGSISWPVGTNQAFNKKLSGYMNSRFAAEIYSQPGCIQQDLQLIQDLTGMDSAVFHEPMAAWTGEQRKSLELAVSLAFEFDVLAVGKIANWDHRSLHPSAIQIREIFERRITGRTLVVSAPGQHRFALDYCDQAIAIADGRLVYMGDPEVCLEIVKEETRRLKYERRQRVNARIARLTGDSGDIDEDEIESDDNMGDLDESPFDSSSAAPGRSTFA